MTGPPLTRLRPVPVEFSGDRGGEAPLTWGQRSIWRITRWLEDGDPYFNTPWVLPVPGRPDLGTVLRALGTLIGRHESLRTTCHQTPEGPVQRIASGGRLTVGMVDAAGAPPRQAAAELAAELAAEGFDYAAELPLRCAVVMADGRPRALAMALSHLAVDAWALDLLAAEWRRLLAGEELPPPAWQPMDQAAFEGSDKGAERAERALRHWRSALERAPGTLFDHPPGTPEDPRFVRVGMESAAVAAAARVLAERWSISTTSVLLTASAVLLAALTGRGTAVMQFIVGNRHDVRLRDMVGTAVQDGLFVLDLPGGTFADAARAGHRQALVTYRHAHYEPYAMMALREEVGPADLSAYFNDVRTVPDWPNLPAQATLDPAALTGRTRTFFVGAWAEVDAKVFFATGPATHTCRLHLLTDTAYLPRATTYALLRGVETLLVRCVTEEVPLGRVAEICGLTDALPEEMR
ncbi:condensation domain-containing protein [Planomonospora corallina]|uniref:Condensation domain-containing protein n=1 Tax=Planomonospora corallina TaxID=1806052 RepID=A0ABV8IIN8_9ACTN